jgi:PA14 domain
MLDWTVPPIPSGGFRLLPRFCLLALALFAFPFLAQAATRVQPVPVPPEMRSQDFTVTVNGKPVDVAHAAASYSFVNFDITGPVDLAITATEAGFWDRGVDVQPWRLGLRPEREGQTIRFRLEGPAKLSISRPRDFLNHAEMLFVFAGSPPPPPPALSPALHYYQPGVYRQSLNPKSGETYYLAPGAYFFGSLNLFNVQGVKVLGRGIFVYDGPQDPRSDEGWMQKPDWHCIGTMNAHDIEILGLTCVIRSRTWSVQMKDSTGFIYDDLRVIGGNPGNANQDGMDWIGSGDGIVRNSFFRASDDVIALMGNWDGYSDADMLRPGKDVHDILVEKSELSTSVSNIVRAGWPRKIFNSRNFTLRDSDVLHAGIGACGQPFGLLGFWGANGARGDHSNYTFENLFLDDWYSLLQMEQEQPALHGFTFRNIWALDQPPLLGSTIAGQVSGVTLDNVKFEQTRVENDADVPLAVTDGATPVQFSAPGNLTAAFSIDPPVFAPGDMVTFTATPFPHARFTWLFGDGTEAHGRRVTHRFTDAEGTDLDGADGAGRFRVLLHVEGANQQQDWAARGVVAVARWHQASQFAGPAAPGLAWRLYPGAWTELPDLSRETAVFAGEAPKIQVDPHGFTRYATAWDGFLDVPVDGGYTFHLMARDGARAVIDGVEVAKTGPPFAQVCGVEGNAMRYDRGSIGLRAGLHILHLEGLHYASQGTPRLLWEGPGLPLADVPDGALSHPKQDEVRITSGGR